MGHYVNRIAQGSPTPTPSNSHILETGRGYIHDQPNVANRVTPIDFLSFVHIIGCCQGGVTYEKIFCGRVERLEIRAFDD